MKKQPADRVTIRLSVSPYESAARFAVSAAPKGYALESMKRTTAEAVCVYVRVSK